MFTFSLYSPGDFTTGIEKELTMNTKTNLHRYPVFQYIAAIVAFFWILIVLTGCFANYGRLKLSADVRHAFENFQAFKNHRYYYSGRENKPSAIIGVHRDYRFESKYWTEVDLQKTSLKELVNRLYPNEYSPLYGYDILDPNGKKAGIWFSQFGHTTIRLENDNRLVVVTPEPTDTRRYVPDMKQN